MPSSASRSLPSFPTRRSSDLAALRVFLGWLFMKGSHINPFYENSLLCRKYHKDFTSLAFVVSGKYHNLITFLNVQLFSRVILSGRSEEHTSELQSRGHLVCRRPPPDPYPLSLHDALPILPP